MTSDCARSNDVTETSVVFIGCNQHARAYFKDQEKYFPRECKKALEIYKKIFAHDVVTRKMSDADRLAYHQKHSAPLMDELKVLVLQWKEDKIAPENSEFGRALNYFLNNEEKLRGFHRYEGAPLSNNISERQMIKIALFRNASKSFKTEVGAAVASLIFSLGLTAILANENPQPYFLAILKHQDHVKKDPAGYMPWNYRETISKIQ